MVLRADVVNIDGDKISTIDLNKKVFYSKGDVNILHRVIRTYLADRRLGTASTKTRSEVRGGGRKPWRQKGTGRARAGSIRSPIWRGGGVVFGPKPRDYSLRLPKKVKYEARKLALYIKAKENKILIVDEFNFKKSSTKKAFNFLKSLGDIKKTLVIIEKDNDIVEKSFRNIPTVNVVGVDRLSVYNILNAERLIFTKKSIKETVEVYSR
ncbi:MAG: 50S ribosomal protein L4 [Actinomycetia bacterium]|nr:50S ribosomal protein L4 [Actinomycetes bacterium]